MLLCTANAKHQIVWIDEFDRASSSLTGAWEAARKPERFDEALPVSLVLNPEFASSEASAESSPRRHSGMAGQPVSNAQGRSSQIDVSLDDGDSAVSEDYDSEHKASVKALSRKPLPMERPITINTPVVVDVVAAAPLLVNASSGGGDSTSGGANGSQDVPGSEWVSLIDETKK